MTSVQATGQLRARGRLGGGTRKSVGLGVTTRDRMLPAPVNLAECASQYPAYTSYLQRSAMKFGSVFSPITGWACIFVLVALPYKRVDVIRANGIKMGRGCHAARNEAALKIDATHTRLRRVVAQHQAQLWPMLAHLPNASAMIIYRGMDQDSPDRRRPRKDPRSFPWYHGWSSDGIATDLAMPDFTFDNYHRVHSERTDPSWTSNSWPDISKRLRSISANAERKKGFIWRGSLSNVMRSRLVQKLAQYQTLAPPSVIKLLKHAAPEGFNAQLSSGDRLSVKSNAHNGGNNVRSNASHNHWLSLYEQCRWAYTFHVPGIQYSAMLK
jgi:hypothetical protein